MSSRLRLRGFAALLALSCAPACGGSSEDDENGTGLCVEDSRAPGNCGVELRLIDPCPLLGQATTLDAVVFPGCPSDQLLAAGDTTGAIHTQSVATSEPIAPITGLLEQRYGFAFFAKSDCTVVAFGCTEADLRTVEEVHVAVRNWSAADTCTPGTLGC